MVDEEFEQEDTSDTVVTDIHSGMLERKSNCVKQYGGWTRSDRWDESPKTIAYENLE